MTFFLIRILILKWRTHSPHRSLGWVRGKNSTKCRHTREVKVQILGWRVEVVGSGSDFREQVQKVKSNGKSINMNCSMKEQRMFFITLTYASSLPLSSWKSIVKCTPRKWGTWRLTEELKAWKHRCILCRRLLNRNTRAGCCCNTSDQENHLWNGKVGTSSSCSYLFIKHKSPNQEIQFCNYILDKPKGSSSFPFPEGQLQLKLWALLYLIMSNVRIIVERMIYIPSE